jgi:hypothetical protein
VLFATVFFANFSFLPVMEPGYSIPEPFQFNPLKHHLSYIRGFTDDRLSEGGNSIAIISKEIRHAGTSVMDVYTGSLQVDKLLGEVRELLVSKGLDDEESFSKWTGKNFRDFSLISLSDESQWILKYHDDRKRYVHLFPARLSPHSFRVKANTLKSAIIYIISTGKDFISREDLNHSRRIIGLSPVNDTGEVEAIINMIEILRS